MTAHFNVGNYRRKQKDANEQQDANFFDANNPGAWAAACLRVPAGSFRVYCHTFYVFRNAKRIDHGFDVCDLPGVLHRFLLNFNLRLPSASNHLYGCSNTALEKQQVDSN